MGVIFLVARLHSQGKGVILSSLSDGVWQEKRSVG